MTENKLCIAPPPPHPRLKQAVAGGLPADTKAGENTRFTGENTQFTEKNSSFSSGDSPLFSGGTAFLDETPRFRYSKRKREP
jgi:hypothetical protein